jgi:hypothetical protein
MIVCSNMREIGNPFAKNVPSASMFAKEQPASTPTDSKEILEGLEKIYSVKEYLAVKMNYETQRFFKELVGQVGEGVVISIVEEEQRAQFDESGGLVKFSCSHTQITSLPELPTGLTELGCAHTKITSLPKLPDGLQKLYCSNNQITELPNLPARLRMLDCSSAKITSLPELPDRLEKLYCYDTPCANNIAFIAELKEKHPELYISF